MLPLAELVPIDSFSSVFFLVTNNGYAVYVESTQETPCSCN